MWTNIGVVTGVLIGVALITAGYDPDKMQLADIGEKLMSLATTSYMLLWLIGTAEATTPAAIAAGYLAVGGYVKLRYHYWRWRLHVAEKRLAAAEALKALRRTELRTTRKELGVASPDQSQA